jgi:hypothetical protein
MLAHDSADRPSTELTQDVASFGSVSLLPRPLQFRW